MPNESNEQINSQINSNDEIVTKETLKSELTSFYNKISTGLGGTIHAGFTPIGTIISFMGITAPENYLICDGTEYNIEDYKDLSDFFEDQFGSNNCFGGDGTTTFAVPDLQGEFLRGSGTNSHTNQGNGANVGIHQDATEHLKISRTNNPQFEFYTAKSRSINVVNPDSQLDHTGSGTYKNKSVITLDSTSGGYERYTSRPTNTSVLYCIKYKTEETQLVPAPFKLGIDNEGNYGYIKAGADTVTPFKSGGDIGGIVHLTTTSLQNKSITGTDGTNTVTGQFDANGKADIIVPTVGPWVFSCDNHDSASISGLVLEINNEFNIYNDVATWLSISNIDKDYTQLSQVLNDTATLYALINNVDASDYMRLSTDWVSDTTSNENAMTAIGQNDYCASILLNDSNWNVAIVNSTYFEKVLNEKIPQMTSNTTPNGIASADGIYDGNYEAYRAFDRNNSTRWAGSGFGAQSLYYEFENPVIIKKWYIYNIESGASQTFTLSGYNSNNSSWESIDSCSINGAGEQTKNELSNNTRYKKYRVYITFSGGATITEMQLYGRI